MIEDEFLVGFLLLQEKLLEAMIDKYPDCAADRFLGTLPKSDQVRVNNENWKFGRHGAGVKFTSPQNIIVDVHVGVAEPDFFDVHRLCLYSESRERMVSFNKLRAHLEKM